MKQKLIAVLLIAVMAGSALGAVGVVTTTKVAAATDAAPYKSWLNQGKPTPLQHAN